MNPHPLRQGGLKGANPGLDRIRELERVRVRLLANPDDHGGLAVERRSTPPLSRADLHIAQITHLNRHSARRSDYRVTNLLPVGEDPNASHQVLVAAVGLETRRSVRAARHQRCLDFCQRHAV